MCLQRVSATRLMLAIPCTCVQNNVVKHVAHYSITRFLMLALLVQFASGGRVLHIHVGDDAAQHVHVAIGGCGEGHDHAEAEHEHAIGFGCDCGHAHEAQVIVEDSPPSDPSEEAPSEDADLPIHDHCVNHCFRSMPGEIASSADSIQLIDADFAQLPLGSPSWLELCSDGMGLEQVRSHPPPLLDLRPDSGRERIAQTNRFLL